jgi:hypothetical protein
MGTRRIEHKEGRSGMDIVSVGIDASKAALDTASLPEGAPGQFTNDEASIAAIVE